MLSYNKFNQYLYENEDHSKHDHVLRQHGFKAALHAVDAGLHQVTPKEVDLDSNNPAITKYVSLKIRADKLIAAHPAGEEHARGVYLSGAKMANALQPVLGTSNINSPKLGGMQTNPDLRKYVSNMEGPWSPGSESSRISSNRRDTFNRMMKTFG